MMRSIYRARPVMLGAAILAAAGCSNVKDQLLEPQQPSIIGPNQVGSASSADGLRVGALSRLRTATSGGESMWMLGGLITDEWKSGDTFSQRNDTDQRAITTDNANVNSFYVAEHRVRGAAKDALDAMKTYLPEPKANFAQMYWAMALAEDMLSESFCNGATIGVTNDV